MQKHALLKQRLVVACASLLVALATPVSAKASDFDDLTKQAIQLYKQEQLEPAIDLERQAVKKSRKKWVPHAVLSYFLWQQAHWADATSEGKLAAKLAPHNRTLLMNLGIMSQRSADPTSGAVYFGQARRLDATDWRGWIGQAQCLALSPHRGSEGLAVLHEMSSKNSDDFNWYYELAQAYLLIERPGSAADAASKAVARARTSEERSSSLFELFSAYIRDNQVERARELKHQVFCDYKPVDARIFVDAASSLVPVLDPNAAHEILTAAAANLTQANDAETLFRLARAFEEKAKYVSYDRIKYGEWLDNEETAYRQAIRLDTSPAVFHVCLASILAQKGKADEMTQELNKAWALDNHDQLTGYLLSKLKPQEGSVSDRRATLPDDAATPAFQVHLTAAKISVTGVSCSCKLRNIAESIRKINGVVLVTICQKIPYKATVLIEQSLTPVAEAMVQMDKKKPFPELSYQLLSTKSIESPQEALQIDVEGIPLNNWFFATNFTQLQPTMPVTASIPSTANSPVSKSDL